MFVLMLGCTTAAVFSQTAGGVPLKKVADVPLPGAAVRFDYQSLDASSNRLYIAHMNADQLVVFDTKKREVVANLGGFPPMSTGFGRFRSWAEFTHRRQGSTKSPLSIRRR